MAYTLSGPEYPQNNPRTGVRLNNGQIVDFVTYGIEEAEEPPVLAPEPTEEAPFNPPAPEPTPEPTPIPTETVDRPVVPEGAQVINEGQTVQVVAPEGQRIANASGYYGDPDNGERGDDVSSILFELLAGETSATVEVSNTTFQNDPAPGTPKVLILLIVYEDIPVQPTPPVIPEQPVITPPEEEPVIEPSPEPTPIPPAEEPTPEPTPSEEPIEEPTEVEPEPLPEPEPSSPSEELGELAEIAPEDLTDEQVEQLVAAAEAILEVAEPGSEEYEQALDALMLAAQADDLELPTELAAIPLLGDVAGAVLDIFNDLGNVGADMSPQVRETAEDIVVVSVIVGQVVSVTSLGAMASTSIRRP